MRAPWIAVWLAASVGLSGAELSLSRISIRPGGAAALPVRYAAQNAQVAALQVDLHYDAANLKISVAAGPAAAASEKTVGSADVAPGIKRVFLMGFTRSVIQDGIVASLFVTSISDVEGSYWLRMTDAIAADPAGDRVGLATIDGIVAVDSGSAMPAAAAFGQVVSGGPWKTAFTLVNPSATAIEARLNFWDEEGQPLVLPLAFSSSGVPGVNNASSVDCSLEPGAICVIETAAPDAATRAGWAELQGPDSITAFAVLRAQLAPDRDAEATVLFESRDAPAFLVPYDETAGFQTGVAVASRSAQSAGDLALTIRDETGAVVAEDSLTVNAHGHVAFLAGGRYPVIAGRRGTIEIRNRSGGRISVSGFRFNPSASFTAVPVIAKQ